MNGTDASEEPMDIPILSHFMLITGGGDDEAEGLARDYGMQVDVVIGPSHPRIRFITPLTQHDLDKAASPTDAARSALRRRIDSSQAMEFVHCSYHIALRAEAVYAFGSFTSNYRQMEGDVGWTVQFAIQMQRPVFGFDLRTHKWYRYNHGMRSFLYMGRGQCPFLREKSAIVGMKKRSADAKELFQRTQQRCNTSRHVRFS